MLRDLGDVEGSVLEESDPAWETSGSRLHDLLEALRDDLNTPEALVVMARMAADARRLVSGPGPAEMRNLVKSRLVSGARLLGFLQQDPELWFKQTTPGTAVDAAHIESLIAQRNTARAARDFARADAVRAELAALGVAIEDGPQGTRWKVAAP